MLVLASLLRVRCAGTTYCNKMVDTIEAVDGSMERAKKYEGITLGAFLATLTISVIVFVAQAALGLTLPSL